MICPHCTQAISNKSHFCVRCGRAILTSPEATTQAMISPPRDAEAVIAALHPSFLFVGARYTAAGVFTVAVVVFGAFVEAKIWTPIAPVIPWMVIAACALAFVNPIYRHLRRETSTYTLTTEKIEISSGVLSRVTRNIPLKNVQDVTIRRSPLKRVLGIGDVVIDSAAATGKITLQNIRNPLKISDEILRLSVRR